MVKKPKGGKKSEAKKLSSDEERLFELAHHVTHSMRLDFGLKKSIRAREIYRRLLSVLGVEYIDLNAPPSEYIRGDNEAAALRAFAAVLNDSPEFSGDGLDLAPGDLAGAETMRQVGGAIVAWYLRNGWDVLRE